MMVFQTILGWRDWLAVRSRWSKLRLVGQSNIVKASVLMPAFGYLLLINDDVQKLLLKIKFDHGWLFGWLLDHLPSTWRIEDRSHREKEAPIKEQPVCWRWLALAGRWPGVEPPRGLPKKSEHVA